MRLFLSNWIFFLYEVWDEEVLEIWREKGWNYLRVRKMNFVGKGSRNFGLIKDWLDIHGQCVQVSSISAVLWFSSAMLKLFRSKYRVRRWLGFCQASLLGVLRVFNERLDNEGRVIFGFTLHWNLFLLFQRCLLKDPHVLCLQCLMWHITWWPCSQGGSRMKFLS